MDTMISTSGYGPAINLYESQGIGCVRELFRQAEKDHPRGSDFDILETRIIPANHPDYSDGDYVIVAELRYLHNGREARAIYGFHMGGDWHCFMD